MVRILQESGSWEVPEDVLVTTQNDELSYKNRDIQSFQDVDLTCKSTDKDKGIALLTN